MIDRLQREVQLAKAYVCKNVVDWSNVNDNITKMTSLKKMDILDTHPISQESYPARNADVQFP